MNPKQEKIGLVSDFIKQLPFDRKYNYLMRLLNRFNKDCPPTFDEITLSFLEDFRNFLTAGGRAPASVCSLLYLLRGFFCKAIKAGLTENFPFSNFYIKAKRSSEKPYYTECQVNKLEQTKTPFKQVIRNAFLFALYTGINSMEIHSLTIVQTRQMELGEKARILVDAIVNDESENELLFKDLPLQIDYCLRLWGALAGLELKPNFLISRNTYIMNALAHGRTLKSLMLQFGIKHKRSFRVYEHLHKAREHTLSPLLPHIPPYSTADGGLQTLPLSVLENNNTLV